MMSVSFELLEKVGRSSKLRVKSPCSPHVVGVGNPDTDVLIDEVVVEDNDLDGELIVDPLVVEERELSDAVRAVDRVLDDEVVPGDEIVADELRVRELVEPRLDNELVGRATDSDVSLAVLEAAAAVVLGVAPVDEDANVVVDMGAPYP